MSLGGSSAEARRDDGAPPARKGLLAIAGVLLAIPVIAMMAVFTYARKGPELWGWPFFFWYQMLWVILTPIFTWTPMCSC